MFPVVPFVLEMNHVRFGKDRAAARHIGRFVLLSQGR